MQTFLRMVEIESELQRKVLNDAKKFAAKTANGSLIQPGKTVKQARQHFYYVCRRLGISRKQLGVTMHGLRHEFANNMYLDVAGRKSPVQGGSIKSDAVDSQAREKITNALGHSRKAIVGAYIGGRAKGRRPKAGPLMDGDQQ